MFDFTGQSIDSYELDLLSEQIESLRAFLVEFVGSARAPTEIDPKKPYPTKHAAEFLGVSVRTLQRRRAEDRLRIVGDGKKCFVMGAELLRYARESYR